MSCKKSYVDKENILKYRPFSDLHFSNAIEKITTSQLKLMENNLYESIQSVYRKFHSTDTFNLKFHSDILQDIHRTGVILVLLVVLLVVLVAVKCCLRSDKITL